MNALNEVLLGAVVVLGPILISCIFGAACWLVKRVVLWIRCRMEVRR